MLGRRCLPRRSEALILWASLALAVSPAGAAELFGPAAASYVAGLHPTSMAVGDFDSDGSLDLAITSVGDRAILLLGDGLGNFTPAKTLEAVDHPLTIAAGDFNSDGALDLVVALAHNGGSLLVVLGNGHGGFNPAAQIHVGAIPSSMIVGDFDSDGNPDIAVAHSGGISIFRGDGHGGFSLAAVAPGGEPRCLAVGDFNDDGALDVAVAGFDPGSVTVLVGDRTGGFSSTVDVPVAGGSRCLALGDVNNDGELDIAVVGNSGLVTLLGDGNGGFTTLGTVALCGAPSSIAAGDLNGDGALDLAVGYGDSASIVAVLTGDGAGGFSRTGTLQVGTRTAALAIADFNVDGAADIAVLNSDSGSVTVIRGDGTGGFSVATGLEVGFAPHSIVSADFNGDGIPDQAVAGADMVRVLLGDGVGGYARSDDYPVDSGPGILAVADFNRDGAPDIAVASSSDVTVSILLNDGNGIFTRAGFAVTYHPGAIAVGDFDGDGILDLAVASDDFGGSVALEHGLGAASFVWTGGIVLGARPRFVAAADLDGDGALDLVIAADGSEGVKIARGDGLGGFSQPVNVFPALEADSIVIDDFDGDGSPDIAVGSVSTRDVAVLWGGTSPSYAYATRFPTGWAPRFLVSGDFNADGRPDLAAANVTGSSVSVLLNTGHGGFVTVPDVQVGLHPAAIASADLNGDGLADLVVAEEDGLSVDRLLNQLALRADTNDSNRVDGFDVAMVGRLSGSRASDCQVDPSACLYRASADVDGNAVIDGDDLALVANRFGRPTRVASPLRGSVRAIPAGSSDAVGFGQAVSEGDLLAVDVLAETSDEVAAANLTVTFEPASGGDRRGQVLEYAAFRPGTFLSGGTGQTFSVDTHTPGEAKISLSRSPLQGQTTSGRKPLFSILLRALREGDAVLEFAGNQQDGPALLTASGQPVPGLTFQGGAAVTVTSVATTPGQRIGAAPSPLDLGDVAIGDSARRTLRISNSGISDLHVTGVTSELTDVTTYFGSAFTVPPYGSIQLPVVFAASRAGVFSGDLLIDSDDPTRPRLRSPVTARSASDLAVAPLRLDFGKVAVGTSRARRVRITNHGSAPIAIASATGSANEFAANPSFAHLDPGQSGDVTVTFQPSVVGELHGALTLEFDAPAGGTAVLALKGAGL